MWGVTSEAVMVVDSATAASRVKIMASASSSSSAKSAHALVLSMPERARIICCQLRAEGAHGESSAWDGERSGDVGVVRVFALLRCESHGIVRAHATWRVRAAGVSGHALVCIVHRGLGDLHRVVRLRLDRCHQVSAHGTRRERRDSVLPNPQTKGDEG